MSAIKGLIRSVYYGVYKVFVLQGIYRLRGIAARSFYKRNLRDLYHIYEGKRCFLIATGPSLLVEDLELLKNEICISMNTIYRLFDKTDWRPSIYGIQDKEVYKKIKEDIKSHYQELGTVMIGDSVGDFSIPAYYFHLDIQKHLIGNNKTIFSKNVDAKVYDGFTITYSMIQIAVYLGFKEIYLLGCDTNYRGPKSHFDDNKYEIPKGMDLFYDNAVAAYEAAKVYTDRNGVSVINCTRGGMLEVFKRESLENVLGN